MSEGVNPELEQLKIALLYRLQGGVTVYQGTPFIHGVPAKAIENPTPTELEFFSPWRCPHCDAHLAREVFICLNLCHLTVPQMRKFQSKLGEAQARVDRKRAMYDKLKAPLP